MSIVAPEWRLTFCLVTSLPRGTADEAVASLIARLGCEAMPRTSAAFVLAILPPEGVLEVQRWLLGPWGSGRGASPTPVVVPCRDVDRAAHFATEVCHRWSSQAIPSSDRQRHWAEYCQKHIASGGFLENALKAIPNVSLEHSEAALCNAGSLRALAAAALGGGGGASGADGPVGSAAGGGLAQFLRQPPRQTN